jgi:peptide/nickel transport system ATP-binding protein/oligopeptide transport system ATP-binding protein
MALACDPDLLIADEPTTALDASVQADIVDLVRRLRETRSLALIWITHDLALLRRVVERVAVMYAGRIVEIGSTETIYQAPQHPYTRALVDSIRSMWELDDGPFLTIEGAPPRLDSLPPGCAFRPRCPLAMPRCAQPPDLTPLPDPGHRVACWAAPLEGGA